MTENGLVWRKSSFSNDQGGECVEIAALSDGGIALRDSKSPQGPILRFTGGEWAAFVKGTREGEFG